MKLMSIVVAVTLVVVVTACDSSGETNETENRSSASTSTTTPLDPPLASNSTPDSGAAPDSYDGEVVAPTEQPEVVFTGPLETSAGSLVVRYEPNSWYRESGVATLPSVGDLHWFLDTEDGCLVVDRSMFIEGTGQGDEITITPTPGGRISIGESIPLWIEGDWLIHNGCARGDPIIHQGL